MCAWVYVVEYVLWACVSVEVRVSRYPRVEHEAINQ